MKLIENIPLNTELIADLITDKNDLYLVWPSAKYPFDHDQWKNVINTEKGDVPFLIYNDDEVAGHAVLSKTENENVYSLSFLYVKPELRSKGFGERMIYQLENYAKNYLKAKKLTLVVRTYNPRAHKCYSKCGFIEDGREDTLVRMYKFI